MTLRRALPAALALLLWAAPESAGACTVCFGGADSTLAEGMNNGILVLLGVVAIVQIGFVAMFYSFWRRAKKLKARRESFQVLDGGVV